MESATWHEVKLVLERALELAQTNRRGYVALACKDDAALQAEVEALLGHAGAEADRFLESPAALPASLYEPEPVWVGRRVGAFRIVSKIASGGMGLVFMALRDDGAFQQTVAIKLMRHDLDSPPLQQRFEHERRIQAKLNHPFITHLMDGGDIDGRPFMVMEYVDGQPIDAYCRDNKLSVHERIALVLDACVAVEYAHAQRVVHRDIKPANLLVTADGKPKLLDFGIAEILPLDESPFSADAWMPDGLAMFTPECAAPEQLRNQPITTATDVYGLGTLLYRLLTGHLPNAEHRSASSVFGLHAICDNDPVLASEQVQRAGAGADTGLPTGRRLVRTLRGDIDHILSKALAREPYRRYGSVSALSADLRRYLDGLPIAACTPTPAYVLGKFIGRHRSALTASLLTATAICVAFSGVLWHAPHA